MDFAWVVNALHRGLKVTRKIWAGDPSYIELTAPGSNSIIAVSDDTQVENWLCLHSDIFADDWEEYVDPKKGTRLRSITGETIWITPEESAENKEDRIDYARGVVHCGEDTGYMAEQLEMLANIYAEKISQRVVQLLQKTDVPLSKDGTDHV